MSTPSRMTRHHQFMKKTQEKKLKNENEKSSYYYMYRALIDYKNINLMLRK
tara:strand:+ start:446 stop:598 length:153 start_codon:yes stop_codon:yes gene_type:complete